MPSFVPIEPRPVISVLRPRSPTESEFLRKEIHEFYADLDNLSYRICCSCHRLYSDGRCTNCRNGSKSFSSENNMDPGAAPKELRDLTLVEKALIAKHYLVIQVRELKRFPWEENAQRAYRGHTICFPQDIQDLGNEFPRQVAQIPLVYLRKQYYDTVSGRSVVDELVVRRQKVLEALLWLKSNNRFYTNININLDNLSLLPEEGQVEPNLLESEGIGHADMCGESRESSALYTADENEVSMTSARQAREEHLRNAVNMNWPNTNPRPVPEGEDGYFAKAFPHLFPTGDGDYFAYRNKTVRLEKWGNSMLSYVDPEHGGMRFQEDERFSYMILNMLRRQAASRSDYKLRLHLGDSIPSLDDVCSMNEREKEDLLRKLCSVPTELPGTAAYWRKKGKELGDMCNQLGCATLFFTLSAADHQWNDLKEFLQKVGTTARLPTMTHEQLLSKYPDLVSSYFIKRVEVFFERLKKKLKVADYWYRVEFQRRGCPHIHGLLWLEDAPSVEGLETNTQQQNEVIRFAEEVVGLTAFVPEGREWSPGCAFAREVTSINNMQQDIYDCVRYQMHDCVRAKSYCQRKTRNGESYCRFGYPKNLSNSSFVDFSESGKPSLVLKRNNPFVNTYIPWALQTWRANLDFQYILSLDALKSYVAKYTAKGEKTTEECKRLFDSSVSRAVEVGSTNVNKIFGKIVSHCVKSRDYSQQEVSMILRKLPLVYCSRDFVTVNPLDVYLDIGNNKSQKSKMQRYIERKDFLKEKLCGLGDDDDNFVEALSITEEIENLGNLTPFGLYQKFELKYNPVRFCKRSVEAIVRPMPPMKPDPDDPSFCQRELLLHSKYSSLSEFDDVDWVELYREKFMSPEEAMRSDLLRWLIEVENVPEEEEEFEAIEDVCWDTPVVELPNFYRFLGGVPAADADIDNDDVIIIPDRSEYEHCNDNTTSVLKEYCERHFALDNNINQFWNGIRELRARLRPAAEHVEEDVAKYDAERLNAGQTGVFDIVKAAVDKKEQMLAFVCGGAGTGKSFLANCIRFHLYTPEEVLVLAYTGKAARALGGFTFHSEFAVGSEVFSEDKIMHLQDKYRGKLKIVMVDEVFMVPDSIFRIFDQRLRIVMGVNERFGGISFLGFGDPAQLGPIRAPQLYEAVGDGILNWIQDYFILTANERQRGDDAGPKKLRDIAEAIRNGKYCTDHYLQEQEKTHRFHSDLEFKLLFRDAVHVCAEKDTACRINTEALQRLGTQVVRSKAINHGRGAASVSPEDAMGLHNELYLADGAQIILRKNYAPEYGAFNGAPGTVRYIHYQQFPSQMPDAVIVELPDWSGPAWIQGFPKLVPLTPVKASLANNRSRLQFAFGLGWGLTVHVAQGMTIPRGLLHLGKREFTTGLTYTAITRFPSFENYVIPDLPNFERFSQVNSGRTRRAVAKRLEFLSSLEKLDAETRARYGL